MDIGVRRPRHLLSRNEQRHAPDKMSSRSNRTSATFAIGSTPWYLARCDEGQCSAMSNERSEAVEVRLSCRRPGCQAAATVDLYTKLQRKLPTKGY